MLIIYIILVLILVFLFYSFGYNDFYKDLESRVKVAAQKRTDLVAREFSVDFLEQKRNRKDKLADDVVEEIMSHNEEQDIRNLFKMLMANDQKIPIEIHPKIREYFETTSVLPEWADTDLIEFGQEIYLRHGLLMGMLLFYKSLPECYSGAKGAEVLLLSGKLSENNAENERFSKRMAETGLFVYNVMKPGGLRLTGKGIVSAQKVRLMHAVIRFHILKSGRWDKSKLNEPINQEDLAGTLISFSGLILEGLNLIGVDLASHEAEAYIHCWAVVGHIMGVDEDLIPRNVKEALALGHSVIDHQKGKSVAGQELTKALLNFCKKKGPGFLSLRYHISMIRMLLEPEYCEMLGLDELPENVINKTKKHLGWYIKIRESLEHNSIFALAVKTIDKVLMKLAVRHLSKNKLLHFYLPRSFKAD